MHATLPFSPIAGGPRLSRSGPTPARVVAPRSGRCRVGRLPAALLVVVLLVLAAMLWLAPSARAETVVLKSGKKVRAKRVEVQPGAVRATLSVPGGKAIVTYAFHRLDPAALLELLARHWIGGEDGERDGAAALRIAAVAQQRALPDEAVIWYVRAAQLDPGLVTQRDAGLEGLRSTQVRAVLAELEGHLRAHQPEALVLAAQAALSSEIGLLLTPTEALRLNALRGLAQKQIDRALGAAALPKSPAPKPAAQGLAPLGAAVVAALEQMDASMAKAAVLRDKATDPGISGARARTLLEAGAKSLLGARRVLRELPGPLPVDALTRAARLEEALAGTWLDVADLYREARRFQTAGRFLRAARLLDPESARADQIEIKLDAARRRPERIDQGGPYDWLYASGAYPYSPYYGYGSRSYGSGYSLTGTGFGYGLGGFYTTGFGRGRSLHSNHSRRFGALGFLSGGHYGLRTGGHRQTHRVVGRRR